MKPLSIRSRLPEVVILAVGIGLRFSMSRTFDVRNGYDYPAHLLYVKWFASHFSYAPLAVSLEAYHPPLYYAIAGGLVRLGATPQMLGGISLLCGCVRLLVMAVALERLLPWRLGRIVALVLAAVFPASLHLDGMLTNEGLSSLLSMFSILLIALLLEPRSERRGRIASALGITLGLGLLTKASAVVLVVATALIAVVEFILCVEGDSRARWRRLGHWALALTLASVVAVHYMGFNYRRAGALMLSGYQGPYSMLPESIRQTPILDRRSIGFVIGWSNQIFRSPYYPSGSGPHARFWPVLVASSFADYWNCSFCDTCFSARSFGTYNDRPLSEQCFRLSQLSVAGGMLITVATMVAFVAALATALVRRDLQLFALLLIAMLAAIGQLFYATRNPLDSHGVIKGAYLQFAAPPLYALFGFAVAWLWHRGRHCRWIAGVELCSLVLVAAYTLYARIPFLH